MMRACYDLVEASGARGMTPAEVQNALGRSHQSISPRMTELDQKGLIVDSGARRRTESGGQATVYVVMPDQGYIAPSLELDIDDLEPEREPDFDPRIVNLAGKLAGRYGGESRKHLAVAKDLLSTLGLEPGATPEYPVLPIAA